MRNTGKEIADVDANSGPERPIFHPLDDELGNLWFRRQDLSEAEWKRLYTIVALILRPYRPSELSGLADTTQELVDSFFSDKVFFPDAKPSRVHVGALKWFYKNYLRDQLDRVNTRAKIIAPNTEEPDGDLGLPNPITSDIDPEESHNAGFRELEELGWSIGRLGKATRDWLSVQEPWVRIYLALNLAPDKEEKHTLHDLAKRYGISNYHSKAVRLGINWDPELSANKGTSFSNTLLGNWLVTDLNLEITLENMNMIHAALKILCREALTWSEDLEPKL